VCGFSVRVGEHSSVFGNKIPKIDEEADARNEEGATIFNSSWLPGIDSKYVRLISLSRILFFPLVLSLFIILLLICRTEKPKEMKEKKKKRKKEEHNRVAVEEDVVEELVLSSDEDESESDDIQSDGEDDSGKPVPPKKQSMKQKLPTNISKKVKSSAKKFKKRKRSN
jgi:nucleolar complex protein 2